MFDHMEGPISVDRYCVMSDLNTHPNPISPLQTKGVRKEPWNDSPSQMKLLFVIDLVTVENCSEQKLL